jgi:hypothetical protein
MSDLSPQSASRPTLIGRSHLSRFLVGAMKLVPALRRPRAPGMRSYAPFCPIGATQGARRGSLIVGRSALHSAAATRLISSLSTKLRLVDQSNVRKALATAEREKMATGPRPWDFDAERPKN